MYKHDSRFLLTSSLINVSRDRSHFTLVTRFESKASASWARLLIPVLLLVLLRLLIAFGSEVKNAVSPLGPRGPHCRRCPVGQQECTLRQGRWPDLQRQRVRELLLKVQLLRINRGVLRGRLPERLWYLLFVSCAARFEEGFKGRILRWEKGADLPWVHFRELLLAIWVLRKHVYVLWNELQ